MSSDEKASIEKWEKNMNNYDDCQCEEVAGDSQGCIAHKELNDLRRELKEEINI